MASVLAFGSYLPPRIMTNEELAAMLGCDPAWIVQASGIERRHVAEEESVVSMGAAAARQCLAAADVPISMVIVSCASGDRRFPGPAAEIAAALGLAGTPAIDLPVASAGSLFAITLASSLIADYGNILIVATEKMFNASTDRNLAILFGDGAGACIVSSGAGRLELLASVVHSDAEGATALQYPLGGAVEMNGLAVIRQASARIPSAISEVLRKAAIAPEAVHTYVMHQANQNLIDRVARSVNVPSGRFFSNIRECGNTSSASMLIAAAEWHRNAALNPGDHVCFAAFGAGYHWGALVAAVR